MSGIVGLFYLDGRPVDPVELGKMTDILAHRGPDDADIWYDGSVGLGHRMLWTTPESLHEKLPATNQSGDLVITADARIDNRDELIPQLGLNDRPAGDVTDSQLILAAYEKWGEECPEKLIGDFAFVIWDGRTQVLFCARDHFGVRPFYYYHSDRIFVFSSEIKALLCLPEVPYYLNELRIAYYIGLTVEDNTLTFYQDIYRLSPRKSMTVTRTGVQLRTYWTLDPKRETLLSSDEAYAEAFRELFFEAVRCRLRSAFPIGTELSGGLDSSSVTCTAHEYLAHDSGSLNAYSAIYNSTSEADERVYINEVVSSSRNLNAHFIDMNQISPLVDMERVFWHGDETFTSPTVYIVWEMCRQAKKQGVRVMLDGLDGDTTVSHGFGYLSELTMAGKWKEFSEEAKALAPHPNLPSEAILINAYGLPTLIEMACRWEWRAFIRGVNELAEQFNIPRKYLIRNYGIKPVTPKPILYIWQKVHRRNYAYSDGFQPFIRDEFSERIELTKRLNDLAFSSNPHKTAREAHYEGLTSGIMPYMFEWANRTATAFGIENRHPFADKRLVEFCLALPPEQKLHNGWTRVVLRRAMNGVLPDNIRWRGGKTANSTAFIHGLLHLEGQRLGEMISKEPGGPLTPYINIDTLQKAYERYVAQQATEGEIFNIWQALTLSLWLCHTNIRTK